MRVIFRYLKNAGLLQYDAGELRLAATPQEFKQWAGEPATGQPQQFHFITECFFMTAYSLHLGVVKLVGKVKELGPGLRMLERLSRTGDPLARMRLQVRFPTPVSLSCLQVSLCKLVGGVIALLRSPSP